MSEYALQLIAFIKILWLACFAYFYGLGGISNKWIRRFIAPIWYMLGVFGFSQWLGTWNYLYLLTLPLMITALHLGYGADSLKDKLLKRARYAIALSFSTLPLAIVGHSISLWMLSLAITLTAVVILGVFNIAKNARNEETLIAFLSYILGMYLI